MLSHARLAYACGLPTQPVCATGSHLTGHSSIRKRGFHYSTNRALSLKCSK
jgi:1-acyl-sn-glycerol-3-phosphate acyltransferase